MRIDLPIPVRRLFEQGLTRAQMLAHPQSHSFKRYIFQVGQPEHVRLAYEAAMGFDTDDGLSAEALLEVAYRPTTERGVPATAASGD